MRGTPGDEEAVAFLVGVCGPVHGEVDGAGNDEFPLAVMGVFWDGFGFVEGEEDDLFAGSLDEVAVDAWVGEFDLRKSGNGVWEERGHGLVKQWLV